MTFDVLSSAGSSSITNNNILSFSGLSSAGSSGITNNSILNFNGFSSAGSSSVTNNGNLRFFDNSSAGNANISNSATGTIVFNNSSTAGIATIVNNNSVQFTDTSTAGSATITNNSSLQFTSSSSAGIATIITNAGATTSFQGNSTGGLAQLVTNSGGTLDISGVSGAFTAGSIAGAGNYVLGANGLTIAGANFSADVSGTISGTGGLTKTGIGVATLSGNNTYTGPTTINGGGLIVNGSIASSILTTVNAGGALAGSGTVGSTVVNRDGFLVPGPIGTPGNMTVAGDLTFQRGSFYVVQLDPNRSAFTEVTGTASLAGTVALVFEPGIYVRRSYTILTADGRLSGRFDDVVDLSTPPNFSARLNYTRDSVELILRAQLIPDRPFLPPAVPIPGLPVPTPPPSFSLNQVSVGTTIDDFFNNGGTLPPAFVPLFFLGGGNLTYALSQLSGEAATGAQHVAFQLGNQFLGVMLDPFVDGRSDIAQAGGPALGFAPEQRSLQADVALAYANILKAPAMKAPLYAPAWTVWGAAHGGANRTGGDPVVIGSHDVSARAGGVTGGLDYRIAPNTVVGFALADGGTGWSLDQSLGGGRSDAFQAGVYGATRFGPAYLAAALAYTQHWMSTDRFAFAGDHLTASFNAQSFGGRVEGGYRFATPVGGLTPYAALQMQTFHTPSYAETDVNGGGFALSFNARRATDTRSELGTRWDRVVVAWPDALLTLRGRLAWARDWVSDPTLTPLFQALPGASFIVNGAAPAKNSALASAGGELRLANGVTLLGKVDGEFAGHSSTYAGTATVRYRW